MPKVIIATNPSDDKPTEYLASWFKKIITLVGITKDTILFDLKKENANREELTRIIEKEKPRGVILNGHGNSKCITGFSQQPLVECDVNEEILKGTVAHFMACDSAIELGPKIIDAGAISFIGYKEKLHLVHLNKQTEDDQMNDPMIRFFLDPAYEVIKSLISGKTVKEAYVDSQNMYRENLLTLITSTNPDYNTLAAGRLYANLTNQVYLGDGDARL